MIIEVAIGIVLGVFILRYWSAILALGVFAAVLAVVLIICGAAIYWIVTNEPVARKLSTLSILTAIWLIGLLIATVISKYTLLKRAEAGVFLVMIAILGAAILVFARFIPKWSADAGEPLLYLFFVPLAGLGAWIWLKFSRLVAQRCKEEARRAL